MHGSRWRGLETERTYCVTAPVPDPIARCRAAGGRRVMSSPVSAAKRGEFGLPQPQPGSVGATAVGGDQQLVRSGIGWSRPSWSTSGGSTPPRTAPVSASVPTLTQPVLAAMS